MMKRTTRAFALLCVLLLAFTAYADVLAVPNGITTIEPEAFSGTAKADAVFIPASATEIAPDAFGSANFTVYGLPGTAAETFAKETGRQFVSVEMTYGTRRTRILPSPPGPRAWSGSFPIALKS